MRNLKLLLLLAAASLTFGQGVFAKGRDAKITVTSTPASASLSVAGRAAPGLVAYEIRVENVSGDDTLKFLKLTGKTKVTKRLGYEDVPALSTADFFGFSGDVTCFIPTPVYPALPDPTAVECTINKILTPLDPVLTFTVIFTTPTDGDKIKFSTKTKFAEYESGDSYSEREDIESISKRAFTTLTAPDDKEVSSYISNAGSTIFTGAGATPNTSPDNPEGFSATIPAGQATAARLREFVGAIDPSCASSNFAKDSECRYFRADIPSASELACTTTVTTATTTTSYPPPPPPPIRIQIIRLNASLFQPAVTTTTSSYYKPKAPNINKVIVEYSHCPDDTAPVYAPVQECYMKKGVAKVVPGIPSPGVPCIAKRTNFPKKPYGPGGGEGTIEMWHIDNGSTRAK
ncbi:MAG: hypothetical protein WA210_18400 [Burkholderiaceae bacterium]